MILRQEKAELNVVLHCICYWYKEVDLPDYFINSWVQYK
jgi:hypothetical protein